MTVLDRSELEASPLSDLHVIASQAGVEGFRRLRKADLIDAILAHQGGEGAGPSGESEPETDAVERPARSRRSRGGRARRSGAAAERESEPEDEEKRESERAPKQERESGRREGGRESGRGEGGRASGRGEGRRESSRAAQEERESERGPERERKARTAPAARSGRDTEERAQRAADRTVEGTVELLGNGSGFLRVHPPESSDEDVYISAAQVRRCELVSGDTVSGPVRTPRRSERYASLIRVETINGQPADSVAEGTRYEELPVSWPSDRIAFDAQDDATLQAIEWVTPFGRGSRVLIVGGARAGKSETLRRMIAALAGHGEQVELLAVLAGVRPEEIGEWQEGPVAPRSALSFAASPDAQGQAVENVVESAKRLAARGAHAIVAVDGLDGLHPHTARRVLAAARNLREGGSLTVIATASRPFGGETTVIALDAEAAAAGRFPALDLANSGTLKAELLVGEDGAAAIAKAHADALDG